MNHYIDKDEMYRELVMFNKTNLISEVLASQIVLLAVNIKDSIKFQGYEIDGMIEGAILDSLANLSKFRVEHHSRNPFHFFSQRIYWNYTRTIQRFKKELNIKSHIAAINEYMSIAYPHASISGHKMGHHHVS